MGQKTEIAWCDSTWNPVRGCTRVSEGCRNCYAERMAARRLPGLMSPTTGQPFAVTWKPLRDNPGGPRWTGQVDLIESQIEVPLRWKKPRRIFVNSMSDTWHGKLPLRDVATIYSVMAICGRHTCMVLTKRPENRKAALGSSCFPEMVAKRYADIWDSRYWKEPPEGLQWPLPNVWEGVSVEDQATADERVPLLLQTPAAVRFISLEPMLGEVSFRWAKWAPIKPHPATNSHMDGLKGISLVIVGGESGPGARPMHPDWARSVRDQCQAAGVPFFFKQWGEFGDIYYRNRYSPVSDPEPRSAYPWGGGAYSPRVGKRAAGRLLDGRTWDEMPEVRG